MFCAMNDPFCEAGRPCFFCEGAEKVRRAEEAEKKRQAMLEKAAKKRGGTGEFVPDSEDPA